MYSDRYSLHGGTGLQEHKDEESPGLELIYSSEPSKPKAQQVKLL